MRAWTPDRVAEGAGARLVAPPPPRGGDPGPTRAVIDSRAAGPGDLFVGLPGANADGGRFAPQALAAGAWGALVAPEHAEAARCATPGVLLAAADPLAALQALARAWRRALGARVVAITGSTGKTSTKDILAAVLSERLRTVASPENLNTEIGLPLAVLEAPDGTEALVLELAMRGPGQIAELAAIAEPDVGVIVNVGVVHLELLGSLEAVAAAKAELIAALAPGATAVVPAGEPLLLPHLRSDVRTVTFGPGGEVRLADAPAPAPAAAPADRPTDDHAPVRIAAGDRQIELRPNFASAHQLRNLLAAVAAARALGVVPSGRLDVAFSAWRGERVALPGGVVIINDCYNANPMSMAAALDDLAAGAPGRRVAVLGDMLELGPAEAAYHRELGARAARAGVGLLVAVGPLAREAARAYAGAGEVHAVDSAEQAAELVEARVAPGDTVLVKGSRGVGLEVVAERLLAGADRTTGQAPAQPAAQAGSHPAPGPAPGEAGPPDPGPDKARTA
jgi:UDP-N-acetylmuramoyl-tripeptide--D-alanyl-D-alanine ligase